MKLQIKAALLLSLFCLTNNALADKNQSTSVFDDKNFSANLTFRTNYIFRGTSFSGNEPTLQGGFDWAYGNWFAGVWGSSLDNQNQDRNFNKIGIGGEFEFDYIFGYASSFNGFDWMIMPVIYTYPGQDGKDARDDTTLEVFTSIARQLKNVAGSPELKFEFSWSPEYFENADRSLYYRVSMALNLSNEVGLDFGYGYTDIGETNDFFVVSYSHWDIGLTRSALGFDFDLRYHDTSSEDENALGVGFALDSEIVFSVSRSF